MQRIYYGFDGLDVAFQGRIPAALVDKLERAKAEAAATRRPVLVEHGGQAMLCAETGARGGYAYRVDTGDDGAIWFFKKSQARDGWNLRASVKSMALALYGLGGVRTRLYAFLDAIVADVLTESIGRVDYCVDFLAPDFVLDPAAVIMHSRTGHKEHARPADDEEDGIRIAGKSGFYTSVTVGAITGRQVIIYDKTREIVAHRKEHWWEIWNQWAARDGRKPVEKGARIWRVEARIGKAYLKEKCGITSWRDLDDKIGAVFAAALQAVRLTVPTADKTRARWPDHPLWIEARDTVSQDLAEMAELEPSAVKAVRRAQLMQTYRALITGLAASYCMAAGITDTRSQAVAEEIAGHVAEYIRHNKRDFHAKMKRAREKYHFVLEGEIDGTTGDDVGNGAGEGAQRFGYDPAPGGGRNGQADAIHPH